jgi:hypothetical protein
MKAYVYLSLTPESLVASHLPPMDFGHYLSTGTRKRLRGQAIYLEIDADKMPNLPVHYMNERLVPYKDGEPKRSVFLSIYRALEQTPLDAMKNLYLATDDGKVLELSSTIFFPEEKDRVYLYQQFNPITTRVASKLSPPEFINFLTDPSKPVYAPRVFMANLKLNRLATDPGAPIMDLPYPNPDHLRTCLATLMSSEERLTKTVIRQAKGDLCYRTVQDGFFVGDEDGYLYYPFPPESELEDKYYSWWRSALTHCF